MVDRVPLLGTRYQIPHYFRAEVRKRGRIFCFPTSLLINLLVILQTLRSGVDLHDNVINITCLGRASSNRKLTRLFSLSGPSGCVSLIQLAHFSVARSTSSIFSTGTLKTPPQFVRGRLSPACTCANAEKTRHQIDTRNVLMF